MSELKAPVIKHYIDSMGTRSFSGHRIQFHDQNVIDPILDKIFALVRTIKPLDGERTYSLWLRAPRGSIEDYGDFEELKEDGVFEIYEDFVNDWESFFPDEISWFSMTAIYEADIQFRALIFDNKLVYEDNHRSEYKYCDINAAEFFQWVCDAVENCIAELEAGTYNAIVKDELPLLKRTGIISRNDYWDIYPEERADFYKYFDESKQKQFLSTIAKQGKDYGSVGRIQNMTAGMFFDACSYGYAANPQAFCIEGLSPKEQYYRFADGRVVNIVEVPLDSPEAFHDWLTNGELFGGHPWEVMRGGNATHVALYVHIDKKGYFFSLAGRAIGRTVETLNFYLALCEHQLPVFLHDAELFIERLKGTEAIGIVSEDEIPKYGESLFPGNNIHSFMHLPWEEPGKSLVVSKCIWLFDDPVELMSKE